MAIHFDEGTLVNIMKRCDYESSLAMMKVGARMIPAAKGLKLVEEIPWSAIETIQFDFSITRDYFKGKRHLRRRFVKKLGRLFEADHLHIRKYQGDMHYGTEGAAELNDVLCVFRKRNGPLPPICRVVLTETSYATVYTNKKQGVLNALRWLSLEGSAFCNPASIHIQMWLYAEPKQYYTKLWTSMQTDYDMAETKVMNIEIGGKTFGPLNSYLQTGVIYDRRFENGWVSLYVKSLDMLTKLI